MPSSLRAFALGLVPIVLSATCGTVATAPPCGHPGVVIACTESKGCPTGLFCDYGYCFEPTNETCTSDAQCTTKGTTCLLYANVCVTGGASCTTSAACPSGQVCDSGGVCVLTRSCATDADCGSGELCGQGKVCVVNCGS